MDNHTCGPLDKTNIGVNAYPRETPHEHDLCEWKDCSSILSSFCNDEMCGASVVVVRSASAIHQRIVASLFKRKIR